MRRYGSKKASRPYERVHKVKCCRGRTCGECQAYGSIRTKGRRSVEKRLAEEEYQLGYMQGRGAA